MNSQWRCWVPVVNTCLSSVRSSCQALSAPIRAPATASPSERPASSNCPASIRPPIGPGPPVPPSDDCGFSTGSGDSQCQCRLWSGSAALSASAGYGAARRLSVPVPAMERLGGSDSGHLFVGTPDQGEGYDLLQSPAQKVSLSSSQLGAPVPRASSHPRRPSPPPWSQL